MITSINSPQAEPSSPFASLAEDCMITVLEKLDIPSLFRFSMTCKGVSSSTLRMWEILRTSPPFSMNYSFLKKEQKNEKDQLSCILTYLFKENALQMFSVFCDIQNAGNEFIPKRMKAEANSFGLEHKDFSTKLEFLLEKLNKRHGCFTFLIQRFPLWGGYIEQDFQFLQDTLSSRIQAIKSASLLVPQGSLRIQTIKSALPATKKDHRKSLDAINEVLAKFNIDSIDSGDFDGGEMLMLGLLKMKKALLGYSANRLLNNDDPVLQEATNLLKQAMKKQAVLANLIIYHLPFHEYLPFKSKVSLAICAAEQNDYSGLYYLLFSHLFGKPEQKIVEQLLLEQSPDKFFPPIEAKRASSWVMDMRRELSLPPSIDLLSLNQLYNKILEKSEWADIPIEVWCDRAYILFKLGKFDQAELLYSKVIKEYEKKENTGDSNVVCLYLWIEMAHIKIHFDRFKEANALYTKASKKLKTMEALLKPLRRPFFTDHADFSPNIFAETPLASENKAHLSRLKKACSELATLLQKRKCS